MQDNSFARAQDLKRHRAGFELRADVLERLEAAEQQRRRDDAVQVRLLFQAFDTLRYAGEYDGAYEFAPKPDGLPAIAFRALRAELACVLRMSEAMVDRRLSHALTLVKQYPAAMLALSEGQISLAHTEVITTAGEIIGDPDDAQVRVRRSAYEAAVLEYAESATPARLRPIARRLAEQYAECTIDERFERAVKERRVWMVDHVDGMSDLTAHLPTAEAHAIYDRLTRVARELGHLERCEAEASGVASGEGSAGDSVDGSADGGSANCEDQLAAPDATSAGEDEPADSVDAESNKTCRTRDQLRTDIFSSLLRAPINDTTLYGYDGADGAGSVGDLTGDLGDNLGNNLGGIQAHIQVQITEGSLLAESLLRDTEGLDFGAPTCRPAAELTGAGPIDTNTVKQLAAATAFWELITQHPETGAVISVDRYRPSAKLRRLIKARDLHCRFPGCRAPAHRCDLDHTIDAARGGPTTSTNLALLCRAHHTLKHHSGWQVKQARDGTLTWHTPTGRAFKDRPPSKVRFETIIDPETCRIADGDPPPEGKESAEAAGEDLSDSTLRRGTPKLRGRQRTGRKRTKAGQKVPF